MFVWNVNCFLKVYEKEEVAFQHSISPLSPDSSLKQDKKQQPLPLLVFLKKQSHLLWCIPISLTSFLLFFSPQNFTFFFHLFLLVGG